MDRNKLEKLNKKEQEELLRDLGETMIPKLEKDRVELILRLQEKGKMRKIEETIPIRIPNDMICQKDRNILIPVSKDNIYETFQCPRCGRKTHIRWN